MRLRSSQASRGRWWTAWDECYVRLEGCLAMLLSTEMYSHSRIEWQETNDDEDYEHAYTSQACYHEGWYDLEYDLDFSHWVSRGLFLFTGPFHKSCGLWSTFSFVSRLSKSCNLDFLGVRERWIFICYRYEAANPHIRRVEIPTDWRTIP